MILAHSLPRQWAHALMGSLRHRLRA